VWFGVGGGDKIAPKEGGKKEKKCGRVIVSHQSLRD